MTRGAAIIDVQVVLPDHWWAIPLQPAQARERSVDALVARQFRGTDNQPLLRVDTRRQLLAQAQDAADSDARLLALSLLAVAGVPVPASLVVHWIDLPQIPGVRPGDGTPLVDLQHELQPAPGAELPAGYQLDLGRMPAGTVLRRVHDRLAGLVADEASVPSLVADYWLERPDGRGLVQLAFATPMVGLRQSLLELFDAIAGAVRWVSERPDRRVPTDASRS